MPNQEYYNYFDLNANGTFEYHSGACLGDDEFGKGHYQIKKDSLFLNYDLTELEYKSYYKSKEYFNADDWAQTTKAASSATDVNMVFNEDYIKGTLFGTRPTDLSVATTMAHEIIHAYLISLLEDHLKNSTVGINDFPTIFDAYVQQQATKNTSILPDAHHELIAGKYVNVIATTIEQFHLGDTFHSGYPSQVYLDMAWGGLTGTKIFNKTYPEGSADRERILDRINTEMKGTPYQGYTPLGTPCKN
ncbi:hypothetical protein KBJ98_02945 [Flavobacterium sp. F-328]|uniref:Uncharacterized protein n=1 Tax=Flavobacterium erciyesense TaxID=2825842 RepID=A0ABS5D0W7_9FLAO|nr:hypothetical protein [Flavobacterium erciyesense]MBQ0907656.1 hypothetical protein [Flavobacterium erciyesense]